MADAERDALEVASREAFYVGYFSRMPKPLAWFMRGILVWLFGIVIAQAVAMPFLHRGYDPGRSDFGDLREYTGLLVVEPVPHLVIVRPGRADLQPFSRYLLVGRGKSGPKIDVEALAGSWVTVTASPVYRDETVLLAVKRGRAADPVQIPVLKTLPGSNAEDLGVFSLRGEIIDSKCYFGTMRPGHGKVHRACAVRCIAGGIPAMLLVEDPNGQRVALLLAGEDGRALSSEVLDYVAKPIEISGRVERIDDMLVLYAEPSGYLLL